MWANRPNAESSNDYWEERQKNSGHAFAYSGNGIDRIVPTGQT